MRFGIIILPERRWAEQRQLWGLAEQMGFDHAWTYDHLVWAGLPDAPWFGTMPTLTAAATVTSTIRLGTLVTSPNFRHPVTLMRDLLAVDDVSGGRLTCGMGVGGDLDARILGGPELTVRRRVDRFDEFVTLLDRLLSEDRVDHDGPYFPAVDARTLPGSVQRPRIPFAVAANGRRTMRIAARHGQAWVTNGRPGDDDSWWASLRELSARFDEELGRSGRDPRTIDRYLSMDGSGTVALESVDRFVDIAGRAGELGFTDVITHWPRPDGVYAASMDVLDEVAEIIRA